MANKGCVWSQYKVAEIQISVEHCHQQHAAYMRIMKQYSFHVAQDREYKQGGDYYPGNTTFVGIHVLNFPPGIFFPQPEETPPYPLNCPEYRLAATALRTPQAILENGRGALRISIEGGSGGWVCERKSNLWCKHQIREALVLLPSSSQNMDPAQLVNGCPLDQLVKISHCCDNMLFFQKDASDLALEIHTSPPHPIKKVLKKDTMKKKTEGKTVHFSRTFKNIWGGKKEVSLKQRGKCVGADVPLSKRTQDFEMGFEDGLSINILPSSHSLMLKHKTECLLMLKMSWNIGPEIPAIDRLGVRLRNTVLSRLTSYICDQVLFSPPHTWSSTQDALVLENAVVRFQESILALYSQMFPSLFSLPYLFPCGIVSISFTPEGSDVLTEGKRYPIPNQMITLSKLLAQIYSSNLKSFGQTSENSKSSSEIDLVAKLAAYAQYHATLQSQVKTKVASVSMDVLLR
eukprot:bmy_15153T0